MSILPTRIRNASVIIADDIRREDNGKLIIIGVYPEGIASQVFPLQIILAMLFQFQLEGDGPLEIEIEMRGKESKKLFGILAKMEPLAPLREAQRYTSLIFTGIPIKFDEPEDYSIVFKAPHGDWETIRVFTTQRQTTDATNLNPVQIFSTVPPPV
jgi:hypothetical protein